MAKVIKTVFNDAVFKGKGGGGKSPAPSKSGNSKSGY